MATASPEEHKVCRVKDKVMSSEHDETKSLPHGSTEAERAFALVAEQGTLTWTAEEESRVRWKLDLMIIPLTFLSGLMTLADTATFGDAALFGMIQDLGLYEIASLNPVVVTTIRYSWAAAVPTLGGVVAQLPVLILAQKFPLGKLYSLMVIWAGVFGLLMLPIHDFTGVMIIRALYGVSGTIVPVFIIYISTWYPQHEQPLRIAIISTGSALGGLIGKGINWSAAGIGGVYATSPWRWMYVVIGSLATGFGVIDFILLPDSPSRSFFLTTRQKAIVIERVRRNGTGMQSSKFEMKAIVRALKDPQIWALTYLAFVISFGGSALGAFANLLALSFGYAPLDVLKLTMPCAGIAFFVILIAGAIPTFVKNARMYVGIGGFLVTIVGNLLLWRSPRTSQGALLGGLYISVFFYSAYVSTLSLISSNIGGSSKKSIVTASVFISSAVGAFVAPFAFKGEEAAEGFPTGIITVLVQQIVALFVMIGLRVYYVRYNKKADLAMPASGINEVMTAEEMATAGYGDADEKDVAFFRYQY